MSVFSAFFGRQAPNKSNGARSGDQGLFIIDTTVKFAVKTSSQISVTQLFRVHGCQQPTDKP